MSEILKMHTKGIKSFQRSRLIEGVKEVFPLSHNHEFLFAGIVVVKFTADLTNYPTQIELKQLSYLSDSWGYEVMKLIVKKASFKIVLKNPVNGTGIKTENNDNWVSLNCTCCSSEEINFEHCNDCDLPDACSDFGCAIDQDIIEADKHFNDNIAEARTNHDKACDLYRSYVGTAKNDKERLKRINNFRSGGS